MEFSKFLQLLALFLFLFLYSRPSHSLNFDVSKIKFVTTVDKRFLSFSLDSKLLARHWKTVGSLRNPKLARLTRQLSPAYLRVGGTDQDNIYFCPSAISGKVDGNQIGPRSCTNQSMTPITELDIQKLSDFVQKTGLDLICGLNVLQRHPKDGSWDSTNSLQLLSYMSDIKMPVFGFELGNEPLRFPTVFNKSISAETLGQDFTRLRNLLRSNVPIFGPDVSSNGDQVSNVYLAKFLAQFNASTLSAVTIHEYSFPGDTATVLDFINVSIMKKLKTRIRAVQKIVARFQPNTPIWLGETSTAWGGGAHNISDRFVSSFMWVDKLGQSALAGISVVVKQDLIGLSYGLIDPSYRPTPNYFISYMFKQLVSHVVLKVDDFNNRNRKIGLRLYLHCDKELKGGIVIFGFNLEPNPIDIVLKGENDDAIKFLSVSEYLLTPHGDDLISRYCNLNGKILKAGRSGIIPVMRQGNFSIPPESLGFWVIKNANVSICRRNEPL